MFAVDLILWNTLILLDGICKGTIVKNGGDASPHRHQMGSWWNLRERRLHSQEAHAPGRSARHRSQRRSEVRLEHLRTRIPRLVCLNQG